MDGDGDEEWYLCYFFHRLLDYRIPEFESLAKLFGCNLNKSHWKQAPNHHPDSPFYFVRLPSADIASKIANRSDLVRGIFELWGQGNNFEELKCSVESFPEERKLPFLGTDVTFKIIVDTFGKVITSEEQAGIIDSFEFIPFKGRVRLKDPQHKFWFMETDGQVINNGFAPQNCKNWMFFGRELGGSDRSLLTKYSLSTRNYLGPTTMDSEIAYLMANQALVRPGCLVYDPFVGTGSILVAAAHFGAITMGADIDIRVIREGRGPNRNVWSNFKQYDLPAPVGLVRADNNARPWRSDLKEVFDAIICDPPYGVRAGGRKSGGRKLLKGIIEPYVIPEEMRREHIPSTASYTLEECLHDLLDMSAQLLVMGGRLVFFYPQARDEEFRFPEHPCLKLVASSEQILSTKYSRVLLTMEKNSEFTEQLAEASRIKHLEFKLNHAKLLEENAGGLRSLVLAPESGDHPAPKQKEKAKYRGKYV